MAHQESEYIHHPQRCPQGLGVPPPHPRPPAGLSSVPVIGISCTFYVDGIGRWWFSSWSGTAGVSGDSPWWLCQEFQEFLPFPCWWASTHSPLEGHRVVPGLGVLPGKLLARLCGHELPPPGAVLGVQGLGAWRVEGRWGPRPVSPLLPTLAWGSPHFSPSHRCLGVSHCGLICISLRPMTLRLSMRLSAVYISSLAKCPIFFSFARFLKIGCLFSCH